MKAHNLLLARKYTERPEQAHDGKVVVMRSNLRWCSDGFAFHPMQEVFVEPDDSLRVKLIASGWNDMIW
jgi:hypothetical protein